MKFDIDKVLRLMEETEGMDLDAASQYVNEKAPEWKCTSVAEGIVCGSVDPVLTAEKYNEFAGDRAVECATRR